MEKKISRLMINNQTRIKFLPGIFLKLIEKTEKILNKKIGAISLVMVGVKKMSLINETYRGQTGPTDTISFAFDDNKLSSDQEMFGEIFLCPEIIKKNAKKYGHSFSYELKWIFVHSLLHLLGYTHETEKKLQQMQRVTERILKEDS